MHKCDRENRNELLGWKIFSLRRKICIKYYTDGIVGMPSLRLGSMENTQKGGTASKRKELHCHPVYIIGEYLKAQVSFEVRKRCSTCVLSTKFNTYSDDSRHYLL